MAEKFFLFGSYGDMIGQLASILALREQLNERDIGSFVGFPVGDYVRSRPLGRKLYIQLYSLQSPPYRPTGVSKYKMAVVTVPEPTLSVLDNWEQIKAAVGGKAGYQFGKWRTTIYYEGGRTTVVQASTKETSVKIAQQLSKLSSLEVVKEITTETKALGAYAKGKKLAIDDIQIYPGTYYCLDSKAWTQTTKAVDGKPSGKVSTLSGDLARSRTSRIALWTKTSPPNLKETIRKMLGISTTTRR